MRSLLFLSARYARLCYLLIKVQARKKPEAIVRVRAQQAAMKAEVEDRLLALDAKWEEIFKKALQVALLEAEDKARRALARKDMKREVRRDARKLQYTYKVLLPGVHPVEFGKPQIFSKHEAIGKVRMEYIEARKDEARELIDIEFEAITEARKYDVDRWYQDAYKSQGLTPDGLELLEEEESDIEEEKVVVKVCPPGAIKADATVARPGPDGMGLRPSHVMLPEEYDRQQRELGDAVARAREKVLDDHIMEKVQIFQDCELDEEGLLNLLSFMELRRYEVGDVVLEQGTPGAEAFILVKGAVSFMVDDIKVGRTLDAKNKTQEPVFGEVALINSAAVRNATVVVESDGGAECLSLLRERFMRLFRSVDGFQKLKRAREKLQERQAALDAQDAEAHAEKLRLHELEAQKHRRRAVRAAVLPSVPALASSGVLNKPRQWDEAKQEYLDDVDEGTFDRDRVRRLAKQMSLSIYPSGATICEEGEPIDSLHVLIEGTIALYRSADIATGRRAEVVVRENFGDYFGDMALINPNFIMTAVVVTRAPTKMLLLSRDAFRGLLARVQKGGAGSDESELESEEESLADADEEGKADSDVHTSELSASEDEAEAAAEAKRAEAQAKKKAALAAPTDRSDRFDRTPRGQDLLMYISSDDEEDDDLMERKAIEAVAAAEARVAARRAARHASEGGSFVAKEAREKAASDAAWIAADKEKRRARRAREKKKDADYRAMQKEILAEGGKRKTTMHKNQIMTVGEEHRVALKQVKK